MPLYEYQCRACGNVTDIRHGFDETNQQPCPSCGGELARRFNAAGIVFKGSGFYVTDSRKNGTATSSSGGSSAGTSTATDAAKPEAAKTDAPKAETPKAEGTKTQSDAA